MRDGRFGRTERQHGPSITSVHDHIGGVSGDQRWSSATTMMSTVSGTSCGCVVQVCREMG